MGSLNLTLFLKREYEQLTSRYNSTKNISHHYFTSLLDLQVSLTIHQLWILKIWGFYGIQSLMYFSQCFGVITVLPLIESRFSSIRCLTFFGLFGGSAQAITNADLISLTRKLSCSLDWTFVPIAFTSSSSSLCFEVGAMIAEVTEIMKRNKQILLIRLEGDSIFEWKA